MPNGRSTEELVQSDIAKVGVSAEWVSMEWGEDLKKSGEKDRDGAVILGWTGDNGDPDNFLGTLLGCAGVGSNNRAQWCYQPFEDLIQKAKVSTNHEERVKLYEEAQVIFKEQAPWNTIAHSTVFVPMSAKVTGFKQSPLGDYRFEDVDISE